MPYSKEDLESFIQADKASLRNYDARMAELRKQVKEKINEIERFEAASGASEAPDGAGETEETT